MADTFDRSNISKTLFTKTDGTSMIFFMRPCSERQYLRPVIEDGGGKVTSKLLQCSIKLAEKGSLVSSEGYVSTKFITDCVEQNKLLETDTYKVPMGTRVRSQSGNSDASLRSFDSNDSMSPAPNAINSTRDIKGRTKYTKEEDVAIINYLIDQRRYSEASGMRVFKDMEIMKVTSHSASSMNTRYRKNILPNIDNYKYDVDPRWLTRLTGGVPVKDKESDFSVDALFTVNRKIPALRSSPTKKFFKADRSSANNQVDENKQKHSRDTDSAGLKHSVDLTTSAIDPKVTTKKDAAVVDEQTLDKLNDDVDKEAEHVDSVIGKSSQTSWHTADENGPIKSDKKLNVQKSPSVVLKRIDLESFVREKERMYEFHSPTKSDSAPETNDVNEKCDTIDVVDTVDDSTEDRKENDAVDSESEGCKSPSDIFEMSDGTMTQSQEFVEDDRTDVLEIVSKNVNKCKEMVSNEQEFDNAETQSPEMEGTAQPQSPSNHIEAHGNTNNNNQQNGNTETQQSLTGQICCNTVSSSSDLVVLSVNSVAEDSFDKMLLDYVRPETDKTAIASGENDGVSEQDSFDELLKDYVSDHEDNIEDKCDKSKKKKVDGGMKNVKHKKSKSTNKQGHVAGDTVSDEERKEIDRCTTICKKLCGKYGLSFDFVVKHLIRCSGNPQRLEAYIMYGPHSPLLPPWSDEDDSLLMRDRDAVQLIRKYGEDDVLYRYNYLTD